MERNATKIKETIEAIDRIDWDGFKSYQASPLLQKLIGLVQESYECERGDESALGEFYDIYQYIASAYRRMGRFCLSALYFEKALDIAIELYRDYGAKAENPRFLLLSIFIDRNYYVDDDCPEVLEKAVGSGLFMPRDAELIAERVKHRRRSLKHDPVEMSEEYLAVIDEIEERIDENLSYRGMGACHEIWALKAQYLAEKGILWKSPNILNPGTRFD